MARSLTIKGPSRARELSYENTALGYEKENVPVQTVVQGLLAGYQSRSTRLNPNATKYSEWASGTGTPHHTNVDETNTDEAGTLLSDNSWSGRERILIGHPILNVVPVSMTVFARARRTGGTPETDNNNVKVFIAPQGMEYDCPDPLVLPKDGSWATVSHTWEFNPAYGEAWTLANAQRCFFGVKNWMAPGPPNSGGVDVTQCYMVVNFRSSVTAQWNLAGIDGGLQTVTVRFDGTSLWNAILKTAETVGCHVREVISRKIEVGHFGADSGVVLLNTEQVGAGFEGNSLIGLIEKIKVTEDGSSICNSVIPIGAGEGNNAFTLKWSDRSVQNYRPGPAANADDKYRSGATLTDNTVLRAGHDGTNAVGFSVRIPNVQLPPGAVIQYAVLQGWVPLSTLASSAWDVGVRVRGDKSAMSPGQIASTADWDGRAKTTAEATRNKVAVALGGDAWATPDLTEVIKEIVAQGGWASGNAIQLFVEDDGTSTSGSYVEIESFNAENGPVLAIRYTLNNAEYVINAGVGVDGSDYHYLQDHTSVSKYGQRQKVLAAKDIAPLANSPASWTNASNALYDLAQTYLKKFKDPQRLYDVQVTRLDNNFKVGDLITLKFRGLATDDAGNRKMWLDVDEALVVLEKQRIFVRDGESGWKLKLSTVDRWLMDDAEVMIGAIESLAAFKTAIKMYTMSVFHGTIRESIQNVGSPGPFWTDYSIKYDNNVSLVLKCKLDIKLKPLKSNVSTAGAATDHSHTVSGGTASSGGSSTPTSGSSDSNNFGVPNASHTHMYAQWDTGIPIAYAGVKIHRDNTGNALVTLDGTTDTDLYTFPTGAWATGNVADSGHQHTVSIGSHTHSVTGSAANAGGAHSHNLTYGIFQQAIPSNPDVQVFINGIDRTSALGGPWDADIAGLDITSYLVDSVGQPLRADNTVQVRAASATAFDVIIQASSMLTASALGAV